jgi:transcription antitermination factor NusG
VYSDRVIEASVAVFPGYIFCRVGLTERLQVLNTAGVQSLAGSRLSPEAIEDETIVALQTAFSRPGRLALVPYLRGGDKVRVVGGPMEGTTGILVRNKGKQRLVISVHLLQRSVEVEVDGATVMPLTETVPHWRCPIPEAIRQS